MRLSDEPYITAAAIAERTADLGDSISNAHDGHELVVVIVLKGSAIFAADLIRHIRGNVTLEYIRAKSYVGTTSQGEVSMPVLPDASVKGKHVLVVEDILDTGRTTTAILNRFVTEKPAGLELCVLLDKQMHREFDVQPDYVGFTIDDAFVVGYGLDYDEQYRHLPDIHTMEE
jgi:hypoxanthine phosphoribosyltransferase